MRIFIVIVLVAATFDVAAAQRSPDTATLDRGDGIPRLGIDFGLTLAEQPSYDAVLRVEPYGQYVWKNGFGIYAAVPISRSFGGSPPPPATNLDNAWAIGNPELGTHLVLDQTPALAWVLRFGVALPLASDSLEGATTNFLGAFPRFTDLALAVPNAWYFRLSASPLVFGNKLFFRADIGIDIGIDDGDGDAADEIVRINAGGGVDLGAVALGLELVNLWTLDEFDGGEELVHVLSGTIRIMGKSLQPVISIGVPLDDALRDRASFFVAAGIQFVIR